MPRGNPNFGKNSPYNVKASGSEPLTAHVGIKMTASLKAKLKEKENWQQFVRDTLAKALELESA